MTPRRLPSGMDEYINTRDSPIRNTTVVPEVQEQTNTVRQATLDDFYHECSDTLHQKRADCYNDQHTPLKAQYPDCAQKTRQPDCYSNGGWRNSPPHRNDEERRPLLGSISPLRSFVKHSKKQADYNLTGNSKISCPGAYAVGPIPIDRHAFWERRSQGIPSVIKANQSQRYLRHPSHMPRFDGATDHSRREPRVEPYDDRWRSDFNSTVHRDQEDRPPYSRLLSQVQHDAHCHQPKRNERAIYLEIGHAVKARVRRAKETEDAVSRDFYTPVTCLGCYQNCLFVIADAKFVVCPDCQSISPCDLKDDMLEKLHGVGLGFTYETLSKMQVDIQRRGEMER